MRKLTVAVVLALGVMATGRASAECKDDSASLQATVAAQESLRGEQSVREHGTADDAGRTGYGMVKSWIAKAIAVEPMSEIECLNDLARARKALAAVSHASREDQKQEAGRQAPVQPVSGASPRAASPIE